MPAITKKQQALVTNLYINKCTNLAEIARRTKLSRPTVRKILRQEGLRDVKKSDIDNSAYLNKNMFDAINDEASAYFLGLLYADGNVYLRKTNDIPTISLTLQERDKHILDTFRKLIAPKHSLYLKSAKIDTQQDQYKLAFSSQVIGDQLQQLGCIPRKSLKLTFPTNISPNLIRHFVRGYFDGDGCISFYRHKNGYRAYLASFASTKTFCKELGLLFDNIGLTYGIYTRKSNGITSELVVGGNQQVLTLLVWMYNDAKYFIKRKRDKYTELQQLYDH
jgi:intein/homing endonuclease